MGSMGKWLVFYDESGKPTNAKHGKMHCFGSLAVRRFYAVEMAYTWRTPRKRNHVSLFQCFAAAQEKQHIFARFLRPERSIFQCFLQMCTRLHVPTPTFLMFGGDGKRRNMKTCDTSLQETSKSGDTPLQETSLEISYSSSSPICYGLVILATDQNTDKA
jgi:hypothetical protein